MKSNPQDKKVTKLIPGYLNGELIVKIYFEFNKEIIGAIRTIPGRRWNQEFRYWYIPKKRFNFPILLRIMEPLTQIDYSALEAFDNGSEYSQKREHHSSPDEIDPIKRFEESASAQKIELPPEYLEKLERKRYSQNTIKTYLSYMKDFVKEQIGKELLDISPEEINAYILKLIRTKGISPSQQNQLYRIFQAHACFVVAVNEFLKFS